MGRRAQGHKVRWKRGWAFVDFTHEEHRYKIALGTRDPKEAPSRAAYEHAAVVSGRRRAVVRGTGVLGSHNLIDLLADWIASLEGALHEETRRTLETYARHYAAYFVSLEKMTDASCLDFTRARLRCVLRKTAQKECSYLRNFLAWLVVERVIERAPIVPALPKKASGKRSGKQRVKPVAIVEAQALAILEQLPERSKRIAGRKWPLRARFLFAWETGLRPSTVDKLRVPENYRPGSLELELDDPDDKARYGRTLDLTPVARAALAQAIADLPEGQSAGVLFGDHNFNKHLKHAATKVLGAELGRKFASYDFRHGRGTQLADAGAPLTGIAYLLGHKQLTTTNRYLAPSRRAGKVALETLGPVDGVAKAANVSSPFRPPASNSEGNPGWPTGFEPATTGATTHERSKNAGKTPWSPFHVGPRKVPPIPDSVPGGQNVLRGLVPALRALAAVHGGRPEALATVLSEAVA